MKRAGFLGLVLAAVLSAGAHASPAPAAADGSRPMWIEKLRDGLYLIRGPIDFDCMLGCRPGQKGDGVLHEPGTVLARATPAGVILVDAKFPQHVPRILELVSGVTGQPVKYLINSHHHPDHASGDGEMIKRGIELIQQRDLKANYDAAHPAEPGAPISFGDSMGFDLGGVKVQAFHFTPSGHTRGDTFTYFPDLKVVHMGDLVIRGMPHIDYAGGGGSAAGFVDAIYQLLKLDFDLAVPGHGAPMTREEIWQYVRKVETMNARMKDAVRRGVPVDRVVPELGLEDLGWARSASTANFLANDVAGYYAEMAAVLAAERGPAPGAR